MKPNLKEDLDRLLFLSPEEANLSLVYLLVWLIIVLLVVVGLNSVEIGVFLKGILSL